MAEDTEKVRSMNVVGREQHAVTPDSFPSVTRSTWWAQKVTHEQMDMRLLAGSCGECFARSYAHLTMLSWLSA